MPPWRRILKRSWKLLSATSIKVMKSRCCHAWVSFRFVILIRWATFNGVKNAVCDAPTAGVGSKEKSNCEILSGVQIDQRITPRCPFSIRSPN